MTSPAPAISFDASALTEPIDRRAVRAFAKEMKRRSSSSTNILAIAVMIFIGVTFVSILAIFVVLFVTHGSAQTSSLALSPGLLGGIGVPVVALAIIVISIINGRSGWSTSYRIARFAAANNLTYEHRIDNPPLPGMIFQIGSSRMSKDLVRGHTPRFVEFGNYQYTTGSGKNKQTHTWGYVAVKLTVPLPNIVLDAVGNNGLFGSNLPASFHKNQRLSLEGNFDQYFELYCPEGYERDALYLFTPDIMARFIDNAAELDVEIIDDWLFLYTRRNASTLDAATWAWLFNVVGALITKFDQWARWRDDRLLAEQGADAVAAQTAAAGAQLAAPTAGAAGTSPQPFAAPVGMLAPPPGVAIEGRRLRRKFPWRSIVFAIIFIVGWFLMQGQFFFRGFG